MDSWGCASAPRCSVATSRPGATTEPSASAPACPTGNDYIFGGLRAGASGFLLKRTPAEELIRAVHTVAAGESLLSPSVTRRVIDRMARQPAPQAGASNLELLTPREGEVLVLLASGLSNAEIAAELIIEESTVKTHVKRILMKLGLRDRVQAVIFAYEHGIAPPR